MISTVVRDYVDQCTAHGVAHLTSQNKAHRIFWATLLCIAVFCFCGHVFILVSKHILHDVISQWDISSPKRPKFPTVTICDAAHLSGLRMNDDKFMLSEFGISNTVLWQNIQSVWRLALGKDTEHIGEYSRTINMVARQTLQQATLIPNYTVAHEKQDAIILCFYNDQPCFIDNFTQVWFPYYHNCVSFTPKIGSILRAGESSGLSLILYGNDRRGYLTNLERLNWFKGFNVLLTEEGHFPFQQNTVKAPLGSATQISFSQQVNQLSVNGKQSCLESGNVSFNFHDLFGNYHSQADYLYDSDACKVVEMQKRVLEKCGCFDDLLPIPGSDSKVLGKNGHHWCHFINDTKFLLSAGYVTPIFNASHVDILGTFDEPVSMSHPVLVEARRKHKCLEEFRLEIPIAIQKFQCKAPCNSYHYYPVVRSFEWPTRKEYSEDIKPALRNSIKRAKSLHLNTKVLKNLSNSNWDATIENISTAFAVVNIYPTSTGVILMQDNLAYPVGNLLSDFGGTLGLWVGCSIVSVVELLWMGSSIVIQWRQGRSAPLNQAEPKNPEDEPATVSSIVIDNN